MIKTENIQKALSQISQGDTLVEARDEKFDRKILEKAKAITLVSIEKNTKPTTIREIDSGLNHVLTTIAQKKGSRIGIDLVEIKSLEKKQKAIRLEKIIQNIRLCGKKQVELSINEKDHKSLLLSLGASTNQVKNTITQSF